MSKLFHILLGSICIAFCFSFPSIAHEIRPASLDITEFENGDIELRWRQPIKGEYTISIAPVISSGWLDSEPDNRVITDNSLVQLWKIASPQEHLSGQTIQINGLDSTITDVLVTINYASSKTHIQLIKPTDPSMLIPEENLASRDTFEYFFLGVEHISSGIDHLLYVLALILLLHNVRSLIFTITAFTLAHSITLACVTLGLMQLRSAPVEAVISLSIVYLAVELVKVKRGQSSLASRMPWLIAFAFGLLHGFGFAGALQEIGLPNELVAVALLLFNLGIEAGQLIFVALVLATLWSLKKIQPKIQALFRQYSPYFIGGIASFWLIERLLAL